MKTIYHCAFLACAVIMLSSCNRNLSYFTEDLYRSNNWSESELKQIQFYVSQDIRLVRTNISGGSDIDDGQIKINDSRVVEEVIIRQGTPGTLIFAPNTDRFAVSFDEDPDKYLMFGPNEKARGRYVLLAKRWKQKAGIITYGDIEYRTGSDSAYATLMVDIKNAQRSIKKSTTATGRKIN